MKLKQPRYTSFDKRLELAKGKIGHYKYKIFCLGNHPVAYIKIPRKHPYYQASTEEMTLDVHGGITYTSPSLLNEKGWWIGWDYAHLGDFCGYYNNYPDTLEAHEQDKKWTTKEIFKEVQDTIKQLEKTKNKRCPHCHRTMKTKR